MANSTTNVRLAWCSNASTLPFVQHIVNKTLHPTILHTTSSFEGHLFLTTDLAFLLMFVHSGLFLFNCVLQFFNDNARTSKTWSHLASGTWACHTWAWMWLTHPWLFEESIQEALPYEYKGFGLGFSTHTWHPHLQTRGWVLAGTALLGFVVLFGRTCTLLLFDVTISGNGRFHIMTQSIGWFASMYFMLCIWSIQSPPIPNIKSCFPAWCVTYDQCGFGIAVQVVCGLVLLTTSVAFVWKAETMQQLEEEEEKDCDDADDDHVQGDGGKGTLDKDVKQPMLIYECATNLVFYHTTAWWPQTYTFKQLSVAFCILYYAAWITLHLIGWSSHAPHHPKWDTIETTHRGIDVMLMISTYGMVLNTCQYAVSIADWLTL